mmetsp:Transcript_71108/g.212011  ORF Transcript_71108/g.212011 Transcript_71108/m.212011 type:complete len:242 (-) Transcript_71108:715-1440(-)
MVAHPALRRFIGSGHACRPAPRWRRRVRGASAHALGDEPADGSLQGVGRAPHGGLRLGEERLGERRAGALWRTPWTASTAVGGTSGPPRLGAAFRRCLPRRRAKGLVVPVGLPVRAKLADPAFGVEVGVRESTVHARRARRPGLCAREGSLAVEGIDNLLHASGYPLLHAHELLVQPPFSLSHLLERAVAVLLDLPPGVAEALPRGGHVLLKLPLSCLDLPPSLLQGPLQREYTMRASVHD